MRFLQLSEICSLAQRDYLQLVGSTPKNISSFLIFVRNVPSGITSNVSLVDHPISNGWQTIYSQCSAKRYISYRPVTGIVSNSTNSSNRSAVGRLLRSRQSRDKIDWKLARVPAEHP